MERNGSQGSDNASTHINPKTRTNASCAPQPLQVNSAANKSWLINYVEAVLPRHIINALTSTRAAPGENTHTHKHTRTRAHPDTHTHKLKHADIHKNGPTHMQGHRLTHKARHRKPYVHFPSNIQLNKMYKHTGTHSHLARSWAFNNYPLIDNSF